MIPSQRGTLVRPPPWAVPRWAVWRLPFRVLAYVLLVDLAALGAVLVALRWPPSAADYRTAGILTAATILHLHLSRFIERARRDHSHAPHVDLAWIWLFPGALLLPPVLAAALVLLVYVHRWLLVGRYNAGRPPYRWLFNVAGWMLSAFAAAALVAATGRHAHLTGDPGGWLDLLVLLAAGSVAFTVNTVIVAGVLVLSTDTRRLRDLIGGVGDNVLDVATLLLGAFVALAMVWWPPFALLMVLPALALHRTVLIQHLELAARMDDKTGVLNAVAWTQQARAELTRTERLGGSMAVFMIDMDGFKQVNDEHGHLVGDTVLQRVARVLAAEVRRTDAVGRFGGDEFAVLLPATDATEALAVAERIRREVRQLPVPVASGLSTSIGVAVFPHVPEDTIEGLLAAADAALYEAKDNGRDQICLATSLPAPHPPQMAGRERTVPWLPIPRRPEEEHIPQPAPE